MTAMTNKSKRANTSKTMIVFIWIAQMAINDMCNYLSHIER